MLKKIEVQELIDNYTETNDFLMFLDKEKQENNENNKE